MLFRQNEKGQGALLGSGVIIPVRHAETVFDLTPEEMEATFALLKHVKAGMDEHYRPDGYNVLAKAAGKSVVVGSSLRVGLITGVTTTAPSIERRPPEEDQEATPVVQRAAAYEGYLGIEAAPMAMAQRLCRT